MFEELYKEAYDKLKKEICSMAGKLLIDDNEQHNQYYIGQLHALNEVIDIMNKVDSELYAALVREVEKETAYYKEERSTDNSIHEQQ